MPSVRSPATALGSLPAGWPAVARELRGRGIRVTPRPGEAREAFRDRIATALMSLYRDGRDRRCFEALYAFAGPGVLAWIKGLTSRELGHVDPAEVLQDTFVNVYRYPTAFREEHVGSFRVWVRTIAGNVVRRAATLRAKAAAPLELDGTDFEDRHRGPVDTVLDDEQERRLRTAWILLLWHYAQAWKELSPRDRRTLHLVEVEGLSYQEAGRLLAVGRSNMKMIVFRSRKRIAHRMAQAMRRVGNRSARVEPSELVA